MHLSDDELVLEYYGESRSEHLESCVECRERLRDLQTSLNLVGGYAAPEPDAAFEQRLWKKIAPQIGARKRWPWQWFAIPALAAAALAIGFFAGRITHQPDGVTAIAYLPQQPIVRAATREHLVQSQVVLMQTANGDVALTKARAEELISSNRMLRRSARQAGLTQTAELLEELERVLLEIAHSPETMSREEATALQARIREQGLLFRVRLLEQQQTNNKENAE